MGHNVGKAAERAVQNSQRVKGEVVTPEQNINFLRGNLRCGLFVPSHQIAALLAEYDATVSAYNTSLGVNGELLLIVGRQKEEIDQFRTVYEQENRSTAVRVERFTGDDVKVEATVSAVGQTRDIVPELALGTFAASEPGESSEDVVVENVRHGEAQ